LPQWKDRGTHGALGAIAPSPKSPSLASDVKRGQNLEAETEAEARVLRPRPRSRSEL